MPNTFLFAIFRNNLQQGLLLYQTMIYNLHHRSRDRDSSVKIRGIARNRDSVCSGIRGRCQETKKFDTCCTNTGASCNDRGGPGTDVSETSTPPRRLRPERLLLDQPSHSRKVCGGRIGRCPPRRPHTKCSCQHCLFLEWTARLSHHRTTNQDMTRSTGTTSSHSLRGPSNRQRMEPSTTGIILTYY